jgi:hypothetical protein
VITRRRANGRDSSVDLFNNILKFVIGVGRWQPQFEDQPVDFVHDDHHRKTLLKDISYQAFSRREDAFDGIDDDNDSINQPHGCRHLILQVALIRVRAKRQPEIFLTWNAT